MTYGIISNTDRSTNTPIYGAAGRTPPLLRYMGTKRTLAPVVRQAVKELGISGPALDLFAGTGSVAEALADCCSVVTNDVSAFCRVLCRARFLEYPRRAAAELHQSIRVYYIQQRSWLRSKFEARIQRERFCAAEGPDSLRKCMEELPHVGNSPEFAAWAEVASKASGQCHYVLSVLYFSCGYFSTEQAIEIDAIRYAIDCVAEGQGEKDLLLTCLVLASAAVINAPGHTAQFMKPKNSDNFKRLIRQWRRSVWEVFLERLSEFSSAGARTWREGNSVSGEDAIELVKSDLGDIGVIYADPPYTKDQYSRFYHLYETLVLYDFPASSGAGRYRNQRFITRFSQSSGVRSAFTEMLEAVALKGKPLILSYPENGLLNRVGVNLGELLGVYFIAERILCFDYMHSTMGGSNGSNAKSTTEILYVCQPK